MQRLITSCGTPRPCRAMRTDGQCLVLSLRCLIPEERLCCLIATACLCSLSLFCIPSLIVSQCSSCESLPVTSVHSFLQTQVVGTHLGDIAAIVASMSKALLTISCMQQFFKMLSTTSFNDLPTLTSKTFYIFMQGKMSTASCDYHFLHQAMPQRQQWNLSLFST